MMRFHSRKLQPQVRNIVDLVFDIETGPAGQAISVATLLAQQYTRKPPKPLSNDDVQNILITIHSGIEHLVALDEADMGWPPEFTAVARDIDGKIKRVLHVLAILIELVGQRQPVPFNDATLHAAITSVADETALAIGLLSDYALAVQSIDEIELKGEVS